MLVSDELLVKKIQAGEFESFEELVKRYEKKMYNIAYRIMGNQEETNDVIQDTFLQAFRKLSSFKGESAFSTWLYRITVNTCFMKKRKEHRTNVFSLDMPIVTNKDEIKREFPDNWSKSPLATLENKELKILLDEAINLLPEDYKTVFLLRDVDRLSNDETAKILKISVPAVKSRLHRARDFLRKKLSLYFKEHKEQTIK